MPFYNILNICLALFQQASFSRNWYSWVFAELTLGDFNRGKANEISKWSNIFATCPLLIFSFHHLLDKTCPLQPFNNQLDF